MTNFSYICIVWISVCVYLLSAEPEISVSGPVGSTAVLPCELMSVDPDRPYIRWNTESEIVFERLGERFYQGEGYECRVDVPMEELRKGNCSLVWSNLRLTDEGIYTSYEAGRPAGQSFHISQKELLISHVNLSVYGKETDSSITSAPTVPPLKETDVGISAAPTVMKIPHPLVLVLSLVSYFMSVSWKNMSVTYSCVQDCVFQTHTVNYTLQLCVQTNLNRRDTSLLSKQNCPINGLNDYTGLDKLNQLVRPDEVGISVT